MTTPTADAALAHARPYLVQALTEMGDGDPASPLLEIYRARERPDGLEAATDAMARAVRVLDFLSAVVPAHFIRIHRDTGHPQDGDLRRVELSLYGYFLDRFKAQRL